MCHRSTASPLSQVAPPQHALLAESGFDFTDESACLDLYDAVSWGKLDGVTRMLPLAKAKGVVNKVATIASEGRVQVSQCYACV